MGLIGVDIGGTSIGVCRADGRGLPDPDATVTFANRGRDAALSGIVEAIRGLDPGDEPVFGVACGGPLDAERGVVLSPPNLPGWDEVAIAELLVDEFGGRAWLMNDANAGALAEWRFGAGRGTRTMAFLTCGTGIGAGLIIDRRLHEGTTGDAGEIGHVKLTDEGPSGFGVAGSVEGWCSGAGIAKLAAARFEANEAAAGARPEGPITTKWLIERARSGDRSAVGVLQEAGSKLGRALAVLIDVLNPEVIVLGSNYRRAEGLLAEPVRRAVDALALRRSAQACRVLPAALGDDGGLIAALCVAWHREGGGSGPAEL